MTKLRTITENIYVAYDNNGNDIEAERLQRWAYNQLAMAPAMESLLRLALKYLQHPDVQKIDFVLPSEIVAKRIKKLLNEK